MLTQEDMQARSSLEQGDGKSTQRVLVLRAVFEDENFPWATGWLSYDTPIFSGGRGWEALAFCSSCAGNFAQIYSLLG